MALNDDWLALTLEEALEPDLPIVDPHHHLWEQPGDRYLLEEFVADAAAHAVRQTVFIEANAMYCAEAPDELKPVGETEFVQGIAAQSASGGYGLAQVAVGSIRHSVAGQGERRAHRDNCDHHLRGRCGAATAGSSSALFGHRRGRQVPDSRHHAVLLPVEQMLHVLADGPLVIRGLGVEQGVVHRQQQRDRLRALVD